MKKNQKLYDLANKHHTNLYRLLGELRREEAVPSHYSGWSLGDCYQLFKFYGLVKDCKYKKAHNQLGALWKETGLVPNDLAEELMGMFGGEL